MISKHLVYEILLNLLVGFDKLIKTKYEIEKIHLMKEDLIN